MTSASVVFVEGGKALGAEPAATHQPGEVAPGTVLVSKYRIESLIAEGGMGVIWLATQLDLQRPVAIKVVRQEFALDGDVLARTLEEARAIAQLRGEHAVRVLEIARLDSGSPFIVMEHLEGNDLAMELAARGPLPLEEVVDLVLQACEGLAETHTIGVVHRDLKPENLFLALQPDGGAVLKILDFGVAKRMRAGASGRRVTLGGTAVGSPQYMAPEQMHSLPDVDQRADIWSLGAILYELLTGVRAFDGASLHEVQHFVLKLQPAPPSAFRPDLPDAVDDIVQRCLEKDRDLRYASVQDLAADLATIGDERARLRAERTSRVAAGVRRSLVELVTDPTASSAPPGPGEPAAQRPPKLTPRRVVRILAAVAGVAGAAAAAEGRVDHLVFGAMRLERGVHRALTTTREAADRLSAAELVVDTAATVEATAPEVVPVARPGLTQPPTSESEAN